MSTVNYLSQTEMKKKFGMDSLGYTKDGKIYLQKGMDKKTENAVREHEFEHVKKGEEGPFDPLGAIIGIGGSLLGGLIGGNATNQAANTSAQASNAAVAATAESERRQLEELQRQYELSRLDTLPGRYTNVNTLNFLNSALLPSGYGGYVDPNIVNTPDHLQPVKYGPQDSSSGGTATSIAQAIANAIGGQQGSPILPQERTVPQQAYASPYKQGGGTPYTGGSGRNPQNGGFVPPDHPSQTGAYTPQSGPSGGQVPNFMPTEFMPGEFEASPDYAFRQEEGNKGIQNYLAANKMRLSGQALKNIGRFNSNLASGEFGNWWNRELTKYQQGEQGKQNYLSRVMQLAGFGPGAVSTAVGAGQTYAGNAANVIGNSTAAQNNIGIQNASNQANLTLGNAYNQNQAIQSGLNNYLAYKQQQDIQRLFNTNPSSYPDGDAYGPAVDYYRR